MVAYRRWHQERCPLAYKCCTSGTETRLFITALGNRLDALASSPGFGQMSTNGGGIALLMGL